MRIFIGMIIFIVLSIHPTMNTECSSGTVDVFRIRDGKIISLDELQEDLKKARIIIIGELHNEKTHHDFQLQIIKALHGKRIPIAIGLEMFEAANQKNLDGWVIGKLSQQEFLEVYYDYWGFPWPLYRDIFLYARDNKLPMVGLNVSRNITKKIAQNGFSSLTKEELKALPPDITCDITPAYREFIKKAYREHGFVNEKLFIQFCEAQMVWDSAMAWNIMKYLKQNPTMTIVVLTGTGHALKRGIPSNLGKDPLFSFRVILPEKKGLITMKNMTVKEADYLLLE
jgi:uncharacterized iron-regulated protein